nr:cytochrome c family protein [uncultured Amaricoccus sp.]
MNTMEVTKIVGAVCGSLLAFLLLLFFSGLIFDTHSEEVAYVISVPDGAGGGEAATAEEQVDVAALVASADVAKGQAVFKKCATCHKIDGNNAVGPHLDHVIGRPVGSVDGFAYSDPMKSHGGDWTPDALFVFLNSPKEAVPGTKMSFAGLPKAEDRANVIAYLESVSQ